MNFRKVLAQLLVRAGASLRAGPAAAAFPALHLGLIPGRPPRLSIGNTC